MSEKMNENSSEKAVKKQTNTSKGSGNGNKTGKQSVKTFISVKERNRYFYIFYRSSLIFLMLAVFSLILTASFTIYFLNKSIPPKYIPVDNEFRYVKITPLNEFEKTDAQIQSFAMMSMKKLFAFDYKNHEQQLFESVPNFTDNGWKSFLQQLKVSAILENTRNYNWISYINIQGSPQILKKEVDSNGIAYWLVTMKSNMIFESTKSGEFSKSTNAVINMKIVRASTINNENGIAIESLFIKFTE